jgi:hypothetical protein
MKDRQVVGAKEVKVQETNAQETNAQNTNKFGARSAMWS